MKEMQEPHKSVLRVPIKKCGGSALPVATTGRHLLTADFLEAAALFVPGNVTASFFELMRAFWTALPGLSKTFSSLLCVVKFLETVAAQRLWVCIFFDKQLTFFSTKLGISGMIFADCGKTEMQEKMIDFQK